MGRAERVLSARAPGASDVDLFRYDQCIVYFDAQISDRASILVCPSKSWTALRFPVRR